MSTKWTSAIILTSGLLLAGCTSEETLQVETLREVSATLNGFKLGESMTRTAYNISEETGFQTVWAEGDVLGIYPIGGDQVSFPLSDGVGTTTAKFDGGSWALRGTYEYAAYYPFSTDFYTIDQTAIPVSFLGQVQTGNNSTAHLAAYDFMAAAGTQPSASGSVDLQFNHVGCFLRMQLTMPNAGTYTSVSIETDGGSFTTQGTVNLAATTPALSATATSEKLTLGLNNVTTTEANQTIVLYMMVAPGNLSAHTLTFTVEDDADNTYTKTAAGKNMVATYAYDYSLTLDASNTYMGHEYVDLGLPSGLLWATCNVGADSPEEYGDYFAWGETEGYNSGKTYFDWSTYKWMQEGYSNRQHITKYTIDDGYTLGIWYDSNGNFIGDNKTVLEPADDAAHVNWGGSWRMPTREEQDELRSECTWEWTTQNGVHGRKVTGPNGNSIFLPAAGYRNYSSLYDDSSLYDAGSRGFYWSSSPDASYSYLASILFFSGSKVDWFSNDRFGGRSVRPVR